MLMRFILHKKHFVKKSAVFQNPPIFATQPVVTKVSRKGGWQIATGLTFTADVAKLADVPDLGSGAVRHAGSTPVIRTNLKKPGFRAFFVLIPSREPYVYDQLSK